MTAPAVYWLLVSPPRLLVRGLRTLTEDGGAEGSPAGPRQRLGGPLQPGKPWAAPSRWRRWAATGLKLLQSLRLKQKQVTLLMSRPSTHRLC